MTEELINFPTGKQHVSYSEIRNWSECSYRHRLLYVDKLSTFDASVHTVFGTAIHEACEKFLKTGEMSPQVAIDMIEAGWIEHGFDGVEKWNETAKAILAEVPGFLDSTFESWEVVEAEEQLYESIENDNLKFKGFIDAIIKTQDKSGKDVYWILDWKTTSWGWHAYKKRDFKVNAQLMYYKLFWAMKHNVSPESIKIGFVLLKRDAKPGKRCELLRVSLGPKSKARVEKQLRSMLKSVRSGMFLKNRLACKFCEFYETEHCT
jgi:hypothetical protein